MISNYRQTIPIATSIGIVGITATQVKGKTKVRRFLNLSIILVKVN